MVNRPQATVRTHGATNGAPPLAAWRGWGVAMACALLVGCAKPTPEGLVEKARAEEAKGDYAAALVQSKAAVDLDANSPQVRSYFAGLLLRSGDSPAAELEFRKALELGAPITEAQPGLMRAMLANGKARKVIDEFGARGAQADGQAAPLPVLGALVEAHLNEEQFDAAASLVRRLQQRAADDPVTRVAQARVLGARGDADAALKALDGVKDKTGEVAWLRGFLLQYGKQDVDKAVQAYEQALQDNPGHLAARMALSGIQFARRQVEPLSKQAEALKRYFPASSNSRFVAAQVAVLKNELTAARDLMQLVVRDAPADARAQQFLGLVGLLLKDNAQALTAFERTVRLAPRARVPRLLAANTYLRLGRAAQALGVLKPVIDANPGDPDALGLVAQAALQSGDLVQAEAAFGKLAKLRPADVVAKSSTSLLALAKSGNDPARAEQALADLGALARADQSTLPDYALIAARMRAGKAQEALAAIDALERKAGASASLQELRGRALVLAMDFKGARAAFEKSLALEPAYFSAVRALGDLDAIEGQQAAAEARFKAFLDKNPEHPLALLALLESAVSRRAPRDEVQALAERADKVSGGEPAAMLMLADDLLGRGDRKAALAIATKVLAEQADQPGALAIAAKAYMASGDLGQGVMAWQKLSQVRPRDPDVLLGMAGAYEAVRDNKGADTAYERAVAARPGYTVAESAQAAFWMRTGRQAKALELARAVQKSRPKDEFGFQLEGDIHARARQWDPAIAAYRAGLPNARPQGSATPARLHMALLAARRTAEADKFSESWLQAHPKDVPYIFYIANYAMIQGRFADAEGWYRRALTAVPDHAEALNNVAWLLARQGKPGAVAMAEQALKLRPKDAGTLDTLAFALLTDKQFDKAVATARQAVELAPNEPMVHLGLAKALAGAGQRDAARQELEALAKGPRFSGSQEAAALLKTLQ